MLKTLNLFKKFKNINILLLILSGLIINSCLPVILGASATTIGILSLQERKINKAIDDITILTKLKHSYLNAKTKHLFSSVNVEVIEGRVNLTGSVKTNKERVDAVRIAWQVKGVSDVVNEIQINQEKKLSRIIQDLFIETIVDSKIILLKKTKSVNYSVNVVNGIVYIMGISRSRAELEEIAYKVSRIKGVKKVITHVKFIDIAES